MAVDALLPTRWARPRKPRGKKIRTSLMTIHRNSPRCRPKIRICRRRLLPESSGHAWRNAASLVFSRSLHNSALEKPLSRMKSTSAYQYCFCSSDRMVIALPFCSQIEFLIGGSLPFSQRDRRDCVSHSDARVTCEPIVKNAICGHLLRLRQSGDLRLYEGGDFAGEPLQIDHLAFWVSIPGQGANGERPEIDRPFPAHRLRAAEFDPFAFLQLPEDINVLAGFEIGRA